ncbi:hypothetical protein MMC25_001672 [Agyrium rufum]|nr:hypothetical protein [Agyrium rufum]
MYLTAIAAVVCAQLLTVVSAAQCNQDNCYRAVLAANTPTIHGVADCSSYFRTTVTPAPSTVTNTASATVTVTKTLLPFKRARDAAPEPTLVARQATVAPSSIPAYATPCSGAVRYSSACSCLGVTATTTTVAPSTVTVTTTQTSTTTATVIIPVPIPDPTPTFVLLLENSGIVLNGVPLDGTYANFDDGDGPIIGFNGEPKSSAVPLSITPEGYLKINALNIIGVYYTGEVPFELLHFESSSTAAYEGDTPLICSVLTGALTCTILGAPTILQLCPGAAVTDDLFFGPAVKSGCVAPTLVVVPT